MENRLRTGMFACALGVLVMIGGCARQDAVSLSPDVAPAVETMETTPVVYPRSIDSTEGKSPILTFREYLVPGTGELEGYGDRFATIKYNTRAAGEPTTLTLLDFGTGTFRKAVSGAVEFKDGYDIVGVSGGDRWIAWEELNGEEGVAVTDDPLMWKLYVAPIDPTSMTCGEPRMIEQGAITTRSRPLFRVEDDALYWMTNTVAAGKAAANSGGAIVKAVDLVSGAQRTVCETRRHYATMSVSGGSVTVTEEGSESKQAIVRVYDVASGEETWSLNLRNTDYVSHFPEVYDGRIAWTVFGSSDLSYPDLFYRGVDGITHRVRNTASDPMPVGRYVFYDAVDFSGEGVAQRIEGFSIGGYDPVTNVRFTVIGGEDEADAMWDMPMARGYSPDTFVVSSDSRPATATAEAGGAYSMRIRRYKVPAQ